ncbi:DUF4394 domain-containing protein [Micromonospora sp. BQ11]|uniref:DUF4394 domain-containing protein n=1 Tax=Micromonospora sp. BQ11 TaxID=3452212 RepID=UPI003F899DD5
MKAILGHRLAVIGFAIAFAVGASPVSAQGAAGPEGHVSAGATPSGQPPLIGGLCGIWWDLLDGSLPGLSAIGLTSDQRLIKFKVDRPGWACSIGVVDLPGTETVIGIDYRVQDGKLYGVGSNGGIYTLSTGTAAATKVSQLTVGLQGTFFGVDFNPSADRLRIISDTGQNLRHNVNPGGTTIADATLTYPPSPAAALGLTGAAYTNNDLDPNTATTLFDIDTTLDQVAVQSPANTGQLAATGKLGVNTDPRTGFDIHSTTRNGRTVANRGYAVLNIAGTSSVHAIDLLTGNATPTGSFDRPHTVVDLAIPLNAR